MENIQIFKYNENPISFQMGEQKMMNATQMAKFFGKRPVDWLRFQQSQEFLAILSKVRNHTFEELVIVRKGAPSVGGGTWMHEDVALEFARWLSPEFAIWCNDRIKELFSFGLTATDEMLVKAATDPEFVVAMMDQIKQSRQKNLELEKQNRALQAKIEEDSLKVNFYNNATNLDAEFNKRQTIIISRLASKFKMKPAALNKFLIKKKVITRIDGGYNVHPQYASADIAYLVVKQETKYDEYGDIKHPGVKYLEYSHKGVELITKLLMEERMLK